MNTNQFITNIGSASKKYALYVNGVCALSAHFETENGTFIVTIRTGAVGGLSRTEEAKRTISDTEFTNAAEYIVSELVSRGIVASANDITTLGLRVVAPGAYFAEHRVIDTNYRERLQNARAEEPLHLGAVLDELDRLTRVFGTTPIVGISDSVFHASMPEHARVYAIPEAARTGLDIARFGYHGLSLASVVRKLGTLAGSVPEKVVVCHLGSGSSIVALKNGVSIDTSMGFSPLEGVPMATRVGDIDAGALIRLARPRAGYAGLDPDALEQYLYTECGLLGLSGTSADMRELIELEKNGDVRARLAIDVLVYRVKKYIGALASALNGLDMLVFSATIGERSSIIRSRVCSNLEYLGISINEDKNAALTSREGMFHADDSRVRVAVVATDEAEEMALITARFAQ
jgi:acetate kinase